METKTTDYFYLVTSCLPVVTVLVFTAKQLNCDEEHVTKQWQLLRLYLEFVSRRTLVKFICSIGHGSWMPDMKKQCYHHPVILPCCSLTEVP